jgi:hypothetical protein
MHIMIPLMIAIVIGLLAGLGLAGATGPRV